MAFDTHLADRIRELLEDREDVTEKLMFSGICFMVNEKMYICVTSSGLLCRVGAQQAIKALESGNCRQMINNGRAMKDFVYVEDTDFRNPAQLRYWLDLCLQYIPLARPSKKKTK